MTAAAMTTDEFRALLAAAGLTQQRAAQLLRVAVSTVARWAQDGTFPPAKAALIRARLKPAAPK